jgi:two-component system, OmpR family, sensor kinase
MTEPERRFKMWLPQLLAQRLYLRIWLTVVAGVAVLMLVVGWAWRVSVEHNDHPSRHREWVVMDAQGGVLASTTMRPRPGEPLLFEVKMPDGTLMPLQVQRNGEWPSSPPGARMRPPHISNPPPWWTQPPYGFVWMLALIGVAVALGLYPVVRRLTQRLEGLQRGVQRWGEGDLAVRVPVQGDDEVADLSVRFNQAAERIEGLMASQKSLLANASHELRSPLARIRMGLELMDVPAADSAMRERTRGEILRNMTELDQLIDEILLASRLDAREADMGTIEAVDLVGLCAEECARVGALLDVPEGLQILEVPGVAKLLRRMVRNLLENARRYGASQDQGEDIILSLRQDGGQVVLRVCDRGPGVPAEYRDRIFEPFFRLPGASERVGGVGLGLALVKSIAERHGGQVRCEGRFDGQGACFTVNMAT